jgi:lipopolysaccharide biosynthesis glycosyltransferase
MTLEIACGATENYAPHLGVMLHSLLARTSRRPLRIWLMLGDPLTAESMSRLQQIAHAQQAELRVLAVPASSTADFPDPVHFHRSIWHRILLPELLPEVARILYLDADMVITDDLGPLWDTPLGGAVFAAVVAPFHASQPSERLATIGVPAVEGYVSSGVLLMDLERMRRDGAVARIRAFAAAHPENPCPEQDALNALFHDCCMRLHPRWNLQPIFFEVGPARLPFPAAVVREAVTKPAIVHYSGTSKPWHYLSKHPLRKLYFAHLQQTPWPRRPLEGRTLVNRLIRRLPAGWMHYAFRALTGMRTLRDRLGRRPLP